MQQSDRPQAAANILLVDDEAPVLRAYTRMLAKTGFDIVTATSGEEALALMDEQDFHAVISDITMDKMDGMALLRAVRERDLDLPVILVTGNPSVDTAARAVEYGALRYLLKPVEKDAMIDAITEAVKLGRVAKLKREAALLLHSSKGPAGDRAGLETSFERGLKGLWMAYQPIVDPKAKQIAAYEALVRTKEPSVPHPGVFFDVAERLGRIHDLGRAIRVSVAETLAQRPPDGDVFMNLHPADLKDDSLFTRDMPLVPFAHMMVLEITERAALDGTTDISERVKRLRSLGFRIAVDDLGAGYAGLSYFSLLSPEVVKLDMSLIRDIHQQEVKRKLVGSLTSVCQELGMRVVAEGVETAEERDIVTGLGCDLIQGFLFARPGPAFPSVTW